MIIVFVGLYWGPVFGKLQASTPNSYTLQYSQGTLHAHSPRTLSPEIRSLAISLGPQSLLWLAPLGSASPPFCSTYLVEGLKGIRIVVGGFKVQVRVE